MIDILAKTFLAFSFLTTAPNPNANYGLATTQDSVDNVMECVLDNTYKFHMDFNGDLKLNLTDVVSIGKRKTETESYNKVTVTADLIDEFFEVNSIVPVYWEIDKIGASNTRMYEVTTDRNITFDVYFELENGDGNIVLYVNPSEETVTFERMTIRG